MLVLSRKKNQTVVIDGGIEIQVLQLKGGAVKLGIQAPDHVRIVRGELEVYPEMIPAEDSADDQGEDLAFPSAVEAKPNRIPADQLTQNGLGKISESIVSYQVN